MLGRVAGAERRCAHDKNQAALPVRRPTEEATMLTMSHAAGANEPAFRDITLGELLQWAAETTPDRLALIAGVPDKANRRQWTYAELYAQSVRVAWALRARCDLGPQHSRMDHGGIRRRHGGRHSGHRQPCLQVERGRICFEAVARRRH